MSRFTEGEITMTSARENSMFDTLRQAEEFAAEHGDRPLADRLYGLGCTLGRVDEETQTVVAVCATCGRDLCAGESAWQLPVIHNITPAGVRSSVDYECDECRSASELRGEAQS